MWCAFLALLPLTLAADPEQVQDQEQAPVLPADERLQEAWSYLLPAEKRDVADWFQLEITHLGTFQGTLVRWAIEQSPIDPGFWPAAGPAPHYDHEVHARVPWVPRKRLDPDHRLARKVRDQLLPSPVPGDLQSRWSYDWATGELRRLGEPEDPEVVFANALAGHPPGLDLARTLVLRLLDDGEQRKVQAAFAHAYTDREGRVYPGVTLYDAWNSGKRIEMPDVDTLGIVHDVLDDWKTWKAPVPPTQHPALYGRIGELFLDARRHRSLREAMADTFARAAPPLSEYEPNLDRFHALWEKHASTPAALAADLPGAKEWRLYLEALVEGMGSDEELMASGRTRRATLARDAMAVRATLVRVMDEFGAMERTALPEPPPAPPEPSPEPSPAPSPGDGG